MSIERDCADTLSQGLAVPEALGVVPPNWPGWPGGKRFALVLVHDVLGKPGFERVNQLRQLESELGFRSSFNFAPTGEHTLNENLKLALERDGFEIGVHGLGLGRYGRVAKVSFDAFARDTKAFAQRWGTTGFSSDFGRHNLAWVNSLGVQYGTSTADVDASAPDADGVETIFPFWVPNGHGSGYVEIPSTIPQGNIDLWKEKLDWIAARGGMALLRMRPSDLAFEAKEAKNGNKYSALCVQEFLRYANEQYRDLAWRATSREVAQFYCEALPLERRNTRRRVCMLAYTFYDSDNRVRRYAEALAKRGDQVEVIALSAGHDPLGTREFHGVTSHQIQFRATTERSLGTYARRLLRFFFASSIFLTRHQRNKPFDLIHVHNVPDFLVFAAWYPKWKGAKLILDIHDIVPELFGNKFKTRAGALFFVALKFIERVSTGFADQVIISNHLWFDKLTSRSVPKDKCSVFVNHVDPAIFYPRQRTRNDGKYVLVFPGSYQWHQGLDIAVRAVALLKPSVPNIEFRLYGGGPMQPELERLASELGVSDNVKFCPGRPLEKIADELANSDVGVVPKRADSFGNEAYSTKIMEFMSQGLPVVASRTKIDSYYFKDDELSFFPSGDADAMANAILDIYQNEALRESMAKKGFAYVKEHGWNEKSKEYLNLVDQLLAGC